MGKEKEKVAWVDRTQRINKIYKDYKPFKKMVGIPCQLYKYLHLFWLFLPHVSQILFYIPCISDKLGIIYYFFFPQVSTLLCLRRTTKGKTIEFDTTGQCEIIIHVYFYYTMVYYPLHHLRNKSKILTSPLVSKAWKSFLAKNTEGQCRHLFLFYDRKNAKYNHCC